MQNRELSWLKFNDRVLSEAQDETVPPLERLRFVTIFTTNLDEFIMVRAGSLIDQWRADPTHRDNKSGMTAREQLEAIFRELRPLYEKRDRLYYELEYILRSYGVSRLSYAELNADEQQYLETYFHESILPALAPLVIDTHHPFPYLPNKMIHIAMTLRTENEKRIFGFLPVPQALPEVIWLPAERFATSRWKMCFWNTRMWLFPPMPWKKRCRCVLRVMRISMRRMRILRWKMISAR